MLMEDNYKVRDGKYTALIAVRAGSNRVPKKNIRNFAGSSLLQIKIEQALRMNSIDEVVVSSDCENMLEIANSLGAKAILRDAKFCSDSIPMKKVYEHLALSINCDHVVYLHVTSPLLKDETLESSIEIYKKLESKYSSLASVEHIMKYIWFQNKAINYDPQNHPRSQDLAKFYCLNFAINILPKHEMVKSESILGGNFFPFFIDEIESIDVDTPMEFEIAEYMYRKINNLL